MQLAEHISAELTAYKSQSVTFGWSVSLVPGEFASAWEAAGTLEHHGQSGDDSFGKFEFRCVARHDAGALLKVGV